jgi:hypothetical protein
VGGAVWTCAGLGGAFGTFSGGIVEEEVGVAGVGRGAGLPGPPGPSGTSVLTGAAGLWLPGRKAGSELEMEAFFSAKVLRCIAMSVALRLSKVRNFDVPEWWLLARAIACATAR